MGRGRAPLEFPDPDEKFVERVRDGSFGPEGFGPYTDLMFIGACALAVVANLPVLDRSDPWLLRRNYLAAEVVEVDAAGLEEASLERALDASRARFAAVDQRLVRGAEEGPRLLLRAGEPFPPAFDERLEALGFERTDGTRFSFFGREYERDNDALVATFEDPQRPGLPVTIWYANSPGALADYLTGIGPQLRPGFASFRHGELELSGPLASDGAVQTTELVDRRRVWSERFESDRRLTLLGFTCRVPQSFEVARAVEYLDTLVAARRATLLWADPGGTAAETPVGAIGEMSVIVHGHVEDMRTLLDTAHLSTVNPVTRTVHALLAAGIPHDGGAAVAEATARRFLGAPAQAWMAPAAGVSIANVWWGRDLDAHVARLVAAGVVPDLARLVETSEAPLSPHVLAPLRGALFQHLNEVHEPGFLRDLWTGAVELDLAAERPAWEARLAALAPPTPALRDALAVGDWRAGAVLVPGPVGYGARQTETSVAELAAFTATDAGALALRATYFCSRPETAVPGRALGRAVPGLQDDLELASAAAAARANGLAVHLELHVLTSPSGGYLADLSLPRAVDLEGFFESYRPPLVHAALLADLLGAELFSVGSGLSNTSIAGRLPEIDALREAGWRELVGLTRGLFDGQITYGAASQHELEGLLFGDALDVLQLEFFPDLDRGPGGERYGSSQRPDAGIFVQRIQNGLERAARYAEEVGQPLLIGATGFASARDAWLRTEWPRGAADPGIQTELLRSLAFALDGLEDEFPGRLVGVLYWNWSSYPGAGGLADAGYTPQGKPSLQWLGQLFASLRLR